MNNKVNVEGASSGNEIFRSIPEFLDVLNRIAESMEMIAVASQAVADNRQVRPDDQDVELRALVLLAQEEPSTLNIAAIADRLGVTRQRLYRLPRFKEQLRKLRPSARSPRKGYWKDGGEVDSES